MLTLLIQGFHTYDMGKLKSSFAVFTTKKKKNLKKL